MKVSDANVFGIRVGVSINLFVKTKRDQSQTTDIFYYRTDEFWNKSQKFDFLNKHKNIGTIEWQTIQPDRRYIWLTEGLHSEFETFISMGTLEAKAAKGEVDDVIFKTYSNGVKTNRDAWACNFNRNALTENLERMIDCYNEQVLQWERREERDTNVDDFVVSDDKKIKWSSSLKQKLKRRQISEFSEAKIRWSFYRPFTKLNLYFDRTIIDRPGRVPSIFPTPETEAENRAICISGLGHDIFRCHISNRIAELKYSNSLNGGTQCFPFYNLR